MVNKDAYNSKENIFMVPFSVLDCQWP